MSDKENDKTVDEMNIDELRKELKVAYEQYDILYEFMIEVRTYIYMMCTSISRADILSKYENLIEYLIELNCHIQNNKQACAHDFIQFAAIATTLLNLRIKND